jgi:hypothetical protein
MKRASAVDDNEVTSSRLQRPVPERTEPVRSMSGLLGAAPPPPAAHGSAAAAAAIDPQIAQGVSAGYRVIDEYLRQGQDAARSAWMGVLPGLGAAGGRGEAELAAMTNQMMRYSTELAAFWTGLFNNVSRPGPFGDALRAHGVAGGFDFGGPMRPPQPQQQPPLEESSVPATRVTPSAQPRAQTLVIAVESKHPVEVSARLDPHGPLGALRVHDLRAADEALPRLRNVSATRDDASLRIALSIPDDQPAGVYSGMIVDDETNLPAGTVCVRVSP